MTSIQSITQSLIQTENPNQAVEAEKTANQPQTATHNPESSTKDTVNITDRVQFLDKVIAKLPVVDTEQTDRVEEIRQRVAEGSYEVNPQKVAEKMLSIEQLLG